MKFIKIEKVLDLLTAIPDLSELTLSPYIFDNSEYYDCDICPAHKDNSGDLYDKDVCIDCWKTAIKKSGVEI
jgi:hypothetical protein